ncbi:MAG: hypothetical protein AABY64_10425 [Bdellovibrionota bacterium]
MSLKQNKYKNELGVVVCTIMAGLLVACEGTYTTPYVDRKGNLQDQEDSVAVPNPDETGALEQPSQPNEPNIPESEDQFQLSICSTINFNALSWPATLNDMQVNGLALALNITGSFEGHLAWSTIANNSDGMGMSLGLLQQNFGSGTLQPLLIEMKKIEPALFAATFSVSHKNSLVGMLNQWQSGVTAKELDSENRFKEDDLFPPADVSISDLDEPSGEGQVTTQAVSKNQISVNWAKSNVLSGSQFNQVWKKEFTTLASTLPYRNLQLRESLTYHNRAEKYLAQFDFSQLRFYLMLYDFVVQNGGFNESHWNQYQTYRKQNPKASEEQRALKLLQIRLQSVKQQYKSIVQARKMTILTGTGTVNRTNRVLPKEYCYEPALNFRLPPLP